MGSPPGADAPSAGPSGNAAPGPGPPFPGAASAGGPLDGEAAPPVPAPADAGSDGGGAGPPDAPGVDDELATLVSGVVSQPTSGTMHQAKTVTSIALRMIDLARE